MIFLYLSPWQGGLKGGLYFFPSWGVPKAGWMYWSNQKESSEYNESEIVLVFDDKGRIPTHRVSAVRCTAEACWITFRMTICICHSRADGNPMVYSRSPTRPSSGNSLDCWCLPVSARMTGSIQLLLTPSTRGNKAKEGRSWIKFRMTIFVFYPPEKGDEGGFVLLEGDDRGVWYSFPFWGVAREWRSGCIVCTRYSH